MKTPPNRVVFLLAFDPNSLLDLKGGSWQQSGGLLQPPWLFRRKASPTGEVQNPECESVRDFTFSLFTKPRFRDFWKVKGNSEEVLRLRHFFVIIHSRR